MKGLFFLKAFTFLICILNLGMLIYAFYKSVTWVLYFFFGWPNIKR